MVKKSKYCDQCDFVTDKMANVPSHKEIKHMGIKYPCDQCEYAATSIADLQHHKQYSMMVSGTLAINVNKPQRPNRT